MAIPEGYEKLAVIGIAWKGEYEEGTVYKMMNAVHYGGSTYVALKDGPAGPPAADNANWMYLAKGFVGALLSDLKATDASGVLGQAGAEVGAQALMDAVADRVMTKLLARSAVSNNLLTTDEGFVLDARQGKELKTSIDAINRDLTMLNTNSGTTAVNENTVSVPASIHTKVCSVGLHAGSYIIFGRISDLSGLPEHFVHAVMSAGGASYFYSTSASNTYAVPTEGVYLSVGGFLVCTGDVELKLEVYQSSGMTKAISGSLGAIRIK